MLISAAIMLETAMPVSQLRLPFPNEASAVQPVRLAMRHAVSSYATLRGKRSHISALLERASLGMSNWASSVAPVTRLVGRTGSGRKRRAYRTAKRSL